MFAYFNFASNMEVSMQLLTMFFNGSLHILLYNFIIFEGIP